MSDDERSGSDSSSDSEDLEITGLIATRQKRATAGNYYATLLANLDDEELQKELLAEDEEEDAGDYEGSDKDDDDEALESSSDEEDTGPPKEGEQEDLEGEKALKKQERSEARKKRKVHDARLKLPAWRQQKKRVKLADDVKTDDGSTSERPKKKSERSNWLPTAADAPLRQSGRSLAIVNREIIHANLKQSAQRSEKQRRVMKHAAEREKSKRWMVDMSQEERLKKCERIERETAREFGRWEREEAERQRLREEAIAAKRRRGLVGPVVKWWSGSVLWEGDRMKVLRMSHGSKKVEDIKLDRPPDGGADGTVGEAPAPSASTDASTAAPDTSATTQVPTPANHVLGPTSTQASPQSHPPTIPGQTSEAQIQPPVPWLQGIQEYAAQQPETPSQIANSSSYTPSAPVINGTPALPLQHPSPYPQATPQPMPPQIYHGWPPGSHQFTVQPQLPTPSVPLVRQQAQRSLIILEQFESLENTTSKRTPKYKQQETTLDPTPVTNILVPESHPPFSSEESRYLISRPRKRGNEVPLPAPPPKQRCAVTSWPAKFRDPKTGLAYADMHQYKVIQRVLAGGCQWSSLLGAWVGPSYGVMGRPARGVPAAFAGKESGVKPVKTEA